METLPENMQYHLLTFADPADLTRIMCTSKNLKSAAEEPALWREHAAKLMDLNCRPASIKSSVKKLHHRTVKLAIVTQSNLAEIDFELLPVGDYFHPQSTQHLNFVDDTLKKFVKWAREFDDRSVSLNVVDFVNEILAFQNVLIASCCSLSRYFCNDDNESYWEDIARDYGISTRPSSEWSAEIPAWEAAIESNVQQQRRRIPEILTGMRTLIESWVDIFMASRC